MQALLLAVLGYIVGSFLAKMLLGAGLAIFTYVQIDNLVQNLQGQVGNYLSGLPADVFMLVSIAKIPQAISVVMSALGVASFIKASKIFIGKAS